MEPHNLALFCDSQIRVSPFYAHNSLNSILIMSFCIRNVYQKMVSFLLSPTQNSVRISHFSYACYTWGLSQSSWFNYPRNMNTVWTSSTFNILHFCNKHIIRIQLIKRHWINTADALSDCRPPFNLSPRFPANLWTAVWTLYGRTDRPQ